MAAANSRAVYPRPTSYALFADASIPKGSFVGEYKGEILDAAAYRRDPINQYRLLGLPKPSVRILAPPLDLVIDARGFGNDLRFVRSGCHPNVVLRPAIFTRTPVEDPDQRGGGASLTAGGRASSSIPTSPAMPELIFGLFASKDITRREEITLPWEWDDAHVVHALLPLL
ncbi:hypothetical protein BDY24DRAFT_341965, partial [Mrakia frigida]|uniref:uncharacterized protein n=1 Tax=Mrakia frigida TaxID=29902 RepID=UPI003FCC03E3